MEEASWRWCHGGGIVEGIVEEAYHGGGIVEEASWRRHRGGGLMVSWRRHHGEALWKMLASLGWPRIEGL